MNWQEPEWPRRWPAAVVVNLATLGPLGRLPWGPGTWGSAAGVLFFVALLAPLPTAALLALGVLLSWFAVAICGDAERRLGARDPGCVVLDEFAVIPFCFLGWPQLATVVPAWVVFVAGFALFRLLDIAKPFGIRALQELPGGWGVVADDLAAALGTCAALHIGIGAYALL